jgi:integrase
VGPSAIASPVLSELSDRYLKEKALSWAQKSLVTRRTTSVTSSSRWGIDLHRLQQGRCGQVQGRIAELRQEPDDYQQVPQKLSLLFVWLGNHHEGIVNHFAGLKLQRVKEVNARSSYTSAEKQRLIQWAKQQEPYRKWIALLGLYTGARANEICQLYADDVQQVDRVWCLNIRDNRPDQKLRRPTVPA